MNPAYQATELKYVLKKVGQLLREGALLVPGSGGFWLSQRLTWTCSKGDTVQRPSPSRLWLEGGPKPLVVGQTQAGVRVVVEHECVTVVVCKCGSV